MLDVQAYYPVTDSLHPFTIDIPGVIASNAIVKVNYSMSVAFRKQHHSFSQAFSIRRYFHRYRVIGKDFSA